MNQDGTRREFLKVTAAAAMAGSSAQYATTVGQESHRSESAGRSVRVVVWDERQPAQKQAYSNYLGNEIAGHLRTQAGISVKSVGLDDPSQGLGDDVLSHCDVLIWWGHVRNGEIKPESGQAIVQRIKAGRLALIALHSAHWSTPFVEAMYERTRIDKAAELRGGEKDAVEIAYVPPPHRYTVPKADARISPYVSWSKFPDDRVKATVQLPFCCFPAYRGDGKPSQVRVLRPEHPIAAGIPRQFEIPQTEMYSEPFHVPEPDEVIFEERWATGEWFRGGAIWKIGRGQVFYFRPGHETYPVYKQVIPLTILTNAAKWLASRLGTGEK